MSKKKETLKILLIRSIHIHETYKEVYKDDRELWQEFLKNNFGKSSSKDLSINQLKSLLEFLDSGTLKVDPITKPQHDEIKIIWAISPAIRVKNFTALQAFIKKIVKKDVSYNLQELTKKEATTIITILRTMGEK